MVSVELTTRPWDGHSVAALRGELHITLSADAAAIIAATGRDRVEIAGRPALESTDYGSLGTLQRLARQAGAEMRLAAPPAKAPWLLTLTGFGDAFRVHASVDDAVAGIGRSPVRRAARAAPR